MTVDYDVIVVGARVAGAPTAMLLARCGHRVLMVDRAEVGSDTTSTHTILRMGMLQLKRWGLADRLVDTGPPPIQRVTLGFGDELIGIDLSDDFGIDTLYAPRRTVLDPLLVDAAVEAGVDLMAPARLIDLIWSEQRVAGVTLDVDGEEVEASARFVVGADGMWSRTAQLARARTYRSYPPENATYYAYYEGLETDGVWFHFAPGVTAGLIPTNDGHTCVYVGWPKSRIGEFRTEPERAFVRQAGSGHRMLSEAIIGASRVSSFRGMPQGLPGFLKQAWGPGWALVGDAGYTKDSISAHGISDALRDAELCARAIDAALVEPSTERHAMIGYHASRDRLSLRMLEKSSRLGSYDWSVEDASDLMRDISAVVKEECDAMLGLPEWRGIDRLLAKAV
jgi:2-polyprenyl-6-methoxyphenol hydroxylase-like FAD-dependent oxidoreductase